MQSQDRSDSCVAGCAQYDERDKRLYVARPWGLLCLNAQPFAAEGIDLRVPLGSRWSKFNNVRLDLRQVLRLMERVLPRRRWSWLARDFVMSSPVETVMPALLDSAYAWQRFVSDVGGIELCRLVARYHPSMQYRVLFHISRNSRLAELARTSPGILAGIVLPADADPSGQAATVAGELAGGGGRDICRRIGFSPSACRSLARVVPRSLTAERWRSFRTSWHRSARIRRIVQHLPQLGPLVLDLSAQPRSLAVLESRVFVDLARTDFGQPLPATCPTHPLDRWRPRFRQQATKASDRPKWRAIGAAHQWLEEQLHDVPFPHVALAGVPRATGARRNGVYRTHSYRGRTLRESVQTSQLLYLLRGTYRSRRIVFLPRVYPLGV